MQRRVVPKKRNPTAVSTKRYVDRPIVLGALHLAFVIFNKGMDINIFPVLPTKTTIDEKDRQEG
jgi:hypothetical protein